MSLFSFLIALPNAAVGNGRADVFPQEVPEYFLVHHLTGSFTETVKWWAAQNPVPDPDVIAHYFILVISKGTVLPSAVKKRHP